MASNEEEASDLDEIPRVVMDDAEDEAMEIALIENLQRKDPDPLKKPMSSHRWSTTTPTIAGRSNDMARARSKLEQKERHTHSVPSGQTRRIMKKDAQESGYWCSGRVEGGDP